MTFTDYLRILEKNERSDLYLSTVAPPSAKFHCVLKPLDKEPMKLGAVAAKAQDIMDAVTQYRTTRRNRRS